MFKELVSQLDKYPHIQQQINLYWGQKDCRNYLKDLIVMDRNNRAGFQMEVIEVLNTLINLHDEAYPEFKPKADVWDDVK